MHARLLIAVGIGVVLVGFAAAGTNLPVGYSLTLQAQSENGDASQQASTDPVFDGFQRSDLGHNWTVWNGNVGTVGGELGMLSKSGDLVGLGIVAWNASPFSADQFSEGVIAPDKDPKALAQVFVRRRASDRQRYGFHWNPDYSRWEIKLDGGSPGVVLATLPSPQAPGPGDTMRIEMVGTQIRGLLNGTELLTVADSTLTEPGQPGVVLNIYWVQNLPTPFFARWSGGSLNVSPR